MPYELRFDLEIQHSIITSPRTVSAFPKLQLVTFGQEVEWWYDPQREDWRASICAPNRTVFLAELQRRASEGSKTHYSGYLGL